MTCEVLLMLLVMVESVGVGVMLKEVIVELLFAIIVVIEISSIVDGATDSDADNEVLVMIFELPIWVAGEVVGKMVNILELSIWVAGEVVGKIVDEHILRIWKM